MSKREVLTVRDQKLSRRSFLISTVLPIAIGLEGLLAACSNQDSAAVSSKRSAIATAGTSDVEPTLPPLNRRNPLPLTAESYELVEKNGLLIDDRLEVTNHPFLERISFYLVEDNGGTLKMQPTYRIDNEQRIATFELSPNRRWFYNKTLLEKKGLRNPAFSPVLRFQNGDQELIHLAFKLPGQDCGLTYQGMRVYLLERIVERKLMGRFVDTRDLDPEALTPGDEEARGNWNSSCLA